MFDIDFQFKVELFKRSRNLEDLGIWINIKSGSEFCLMDLDLKFSFDEKVFYRQGYVVLFISLILLVNDAVSLFFVLRRY